MPRASRHFLPGHVWHITHRCHKQQFLLKFARDRRQWLHWLFEARKRYGLCVLNYVVTSNHIHLLVRDQGKGEIARSMQLVEGCTARQFNNRKCRTGAYWEDRYHATAIESGEHLARCMVYIDLNMVRAGVVEHPAEWAHNGYNEIFTPPCRYHLIEIEELTQLLGFKHVDRMRATYRQWVQEALDKSKLVRESQWSESIAVGHPDFLESIRQELYPDIPGRHITEHNGTYQLSEESAAYWLNFTAKNGTLRQEESQNKTKSIMPIVG
ncbi:MAG: transposase [Gammaproteobacteria bacterium]